MLLSADAAGYWRWFFLAVAFVFAAAFKATPRNDDKRSVVFGLAAVIALLLAFARAVFGTEVIVVRQVGGNDPAITRHVLVFADARHTFADGHVETIEGSPGTLVVNDTQRTLRIEGITYGSIALPRTRSNVAPNKITKAESGIDYVGPLDAPPETISSETSFAVKHWLTW